MIPDLSNYNVYICKDGRVRAYNKITHAVTSYPRLLMEIKLGRPLLKTEDVHHIDEDPLNNDLNNLKVIDHQEHDRMHAIENGFTKRKIYFDKQLTCPVCEKEFIWTARQQGQYHHKTKVTEDTRKFDRQPPCCSKECAGKYATMIQYGNKDFIGDLKPKERICPICNNTFIWKTTSQWRFKHNMNEIPEPCCSLKCTWELRKRIKSKNENIA